VSAVWPAVGIPQPLNTKGWSEVLDVDLRKIGDHDFLVTPTVTEDGITYSVTNSGNLDTAEFEEGEGLKLNAAASGGFTIEGTGCVGFDLSDLDIDQADDVCIQVLLVPSDAGGMGTSDWVAGVQVRDGTSGFGVFNEDTGAKEGGRWFRAQSGVEKYSNIVDADALWPYLELRVCAQFTACQPVWNAWPGGFKVPGDVANADAAVDELTGSFDNEPRDSHYIDVTSARVEFMCWRNNTGSDYDVHIRRLRILKR